MNNKSNSFSNNISVSKASNVSNISPVTNTSSTPNISNLSNPSMASETVVIGIDLGTRFSCISIWKNKRFEIISDQFGNRTIPSVVAFIDRRN